MDIIWYIPVTILLCFVEKIRLDIALKQLKENINHTISTVLALSTGVLLFFIVSFKGDILWQDLVRLPVFGLGCLGIRLVFYDPVLNLFRGRKLTYESSATTSVDDQLEVKYKIAFWLQRAIGALLSTGMIILLNYLN